jgi:hypothetical protein
MICYDGIGFPRQEMIFQTQFQKKDISFPHRNLKLKFSVSYCDLCFLEIHLTQNFLIYEPDRFVIWNKTCQIQEIPIWNRYILFKEYDYEIYDKKDKILDFNGVYLSVYE